MKQYCRYCSYCCYGDVVYCGYKNKTMTEESAKRVNNCKHFSFNSIDVFDPDKEYKPRKEKETKQISLFDCETEGK